MLASFCLQKHNFYKAYNDRLTISLKFKEDKEMSKKKVVRMENQEQVVKDAEYREIENDTETEGTEETPETDTKEPEKANKKPEKKEEKESFFHSRKFKICLGVLGTAAVGGLAYYLGNRNGLSSRSVSDTVIDGTAKVLETVTENVPVQAITEQPAMNTIKTAVSETVATAE